MPPCPYWTMSVIVVCPSPNPSDLSFDYVCTYLSQVVEDTWNYTYLLAVHSYYLPLAPFPGFFGFSLQGDKVSGKRR